MPWHGRTFIPIHYIFLKIDAAAAASCEIFAFLHAYYLKILKIYKEKL